MGFPRSIIIIFILANIILVIFISVGLSFPPYPFWAVEAVEGMFGTYLLLVCLIVFFALVSLLEDRVVQQSILV